MNKPIVDLNQSNQDYSIFLPSISGFYTGTIDHPGTRTPPGFELGLDGLNFLKPKDAYFNYKYGLYSAGHAQLDTAKSDISEAMIQKRDRKNSFILGDSGGFQIITGILKCDWKNFYTDDTLRHKILNWLEHTADYSMTLDIPTLAASEPFSSRNGIKNFQQCLDYTKFNNEWFLKHRKYQTKLLNSMQGRTVDEARIWFDEVKDYAFDGAGFGGSTSKNLVVILKLLVWMRDYGMMKQGEQDWLHYLGVSRVEYASYYTTIQRVLRDTVNPDINVSYDAASAFIMATKGQHYDNILLNEKKFIASSGPVIDDKRFAGSTLPMPNMSPIYQRLTAGDLCVYNHGVPDMAAMEAAYRAKIATESGGSFDFGSEIDFDQVFRDKELLNDPALWEEQGGKNKINKVGKTSWDTSSYLYVMAHNVYKTIETLQQVNQIVDLGQQVAGEFDYKEFTTMAARKGKLGISDYVPTNIMVTNRIIEEVLRSETPMDIIDDVANYLDSQSIVKGFRDTTTSFNNLFD
jgi:hypothetical protein